MATTDTPDTKQLKVNDRVKRSNGTGCIGTVKSIRDESVSSAAMLPENKEKSLMITVQWDNGTLSTFGPDSLTPA